MRIKVFGQKVKVQGKGRHLAFFGDSTRTDWRVVLAIALAAIVAGGTYAETRLAAVRAAAEKGELRKGGEETLEVPEASEAIRALEARGPAPLAATSAAASSTEAATTTAGSSN